MIKRSFRSPTYKTARTQWKFSKLSISCRVKIHAIKVGILNLYTFFPQNSNLSIFADSVNVQDLNPDRSRVLITIKSAGDHFGKLLDFTLYEHDRNYLYNIYQRVENRKKICQLYKNDKQNIS